MDGGGGWRVWGEGEKGRRNTRVQDAETNLQSLDRACRVYFNVTIENDSCALKPCDITTQGVWDDINRNI